MFILIYNFFKNTRFLNLLSHYADNRTYWSEGSVETWTNEIDNQRDILSRYANIPKNKIIVMLEYEHLKANCLIQSCLCEETTTYRVTALLTSRQAAIIPISP